MRVPAVQSRLFPMENSLLPGYVPLPLIQFLLFGRQYGCPVVQPQAVSLQLRLLYFDLLPVLLHLLSISGHLALDLAQRRIDRPTGLFFKSSCPCKTSEPVRTDGYCGTKSRYNRWRVAHQQMDGGTAALGQVARRDYC